MSGLQRLCVFCGSKHGSQVAYTTAARKVGRQLARRGVDLVYGGGDVGLMGEVANAALGEGGVVIGVLPEFMTGAEVAHPALTELHVVASMHERKAMMSELADGFLAMPGGWGTLEELFEMITWSQLRLHTKPVGILNVSGFFDRLVEFLDEAVETGFIKPEHRRLLQVDADIDRLLDVMVTRVETDGSSFRGEHET